MSLRERLRQRQLPTTHYDLQVEDPSDALAAFETARAALRKALPDVREVAEETVRSARAAVEACFERITFRALLPGDFEALLAAHKPTEEQRADGAAEWNADTFPRALIAACAEGDMSEDEWADFLAKGCSRGEVDAMFVLVAGVNLRAPDLSTLPKD